MEQTRAGQRAAVEGEAQDDGQQGRKVHIVNQIASKEASDCSSMH